MNVRPLGSIVNENDIPVLVSADYLLFGYTRHCSFMSVAYPVENKQRVGTNKIRKLFMETLYYDLKTKTLANLKSSKEKLLFNADDKVLVLKTKPKNEFQYVIGTVVNSNDQRVLDVKVKDKIEQYHSHQLIKLKYEK